MIKIPTTHLRLGPGAPGLSHLLKRAFITLLLVSSAACGIADLGKDLDPGAIRGTVRLDGTPQSGIQVQFTRDGDSAPEASATTGSDGSYRTTLKADEFWKVSIVPPDGVICSEGTTIRVQGGGDHTHDFECRSLRGLLNGEVRLDGNPAPGTTVFIENKDSGELDTAVTDVGGAFSITVMPGDYIVSTFMPTATCESVEATVSLAEPGSAPIFCTSLPGTIQGQVRSDGQPAPGRTVSLFNRDTQSQATVVTDGAGFYQLQVPPGFVEVIVSLDGDVCPILLGGTLVPAGGVADLDVNCLTLGGTHDMTFTQSATTCGGGGGPPFTVEARFDRVDDPVLGTFFNLAFGDRPAETWIPLFQDAQSGRLSGTGPQFDDGTGVLVQETVILDPMVSATDPTRVETNGTVDVLFTGAGGASCTTTFDATSLERGGS